MTVTLLSLAAGLWLLMKAADILIGSATTLARIMGIPTLVVGLTIVAFGTSAPELFVSARAALNGAADISMGNIIGSNICNVLLIIGFTALLSPLEASRAVIRREMPLMLLALGLLVVLSADGILSRTDGAILFAGILSYLGLTYYLIATGAHADALEAIEEEVLEQTEQAKGIKAASLGILGGLAVMILASEWIVSSAVWIAREAGISELGISVTLIAFGTSLPELATTLAATRQGQADMAIGNAIGSNLFNVLCVLGITGLIAPLSVSTEALNFDLPFMLLSCIAAWGVIAVSKRLHYTQAVVFLAGYGYYIMHTLS